MSKRKPEFTVGALLVKSGQRTLSSVTAEVLMVVM